VEGRPWVQVPLGACELTNKKKCRWKMLCVPMSCIYIFVLDI